MTVTVDTTGKTSVIIPATENGALPANTKTATISSRPKDLWNVDNFQDLPPYAICVTGNSLETNATTTICNDGAFASNPSAIH